MENASKALIIAGAILLSILLISLGIMVYNNAKNTVNNTGLDEQQIQTFNAKWQTYLGTTKSANEIREMYRAVIASNGSEQKNGTNRFIAIGANLNAGSATVAFPTTKPTISEPSAGTQATNINNSKTYTVTANYTAEGMLSKLCWKQN